MARNKGFVAPGSYESYEASAPDKIYPKGYADRVPTLTCAACGQTFLYRGIEDAPYVAGSTYDSETGEFVPTYNGPVYCDKCQRKFSGGPLDGTQVKDLYGDVK